MRLQHAERLRGGLKSGAGKDPTAHDLSAHPHHETQTPLADSPTDPNGVLQTFPKPDIELRTLEEGQTVLHTAIRIGNLAVIRLLVEAYPDLLSTTNLSGLSPIGEAQGLLDHYGQFCAMMARQSSRSPATRAALVEAVSMLKECGAHA